MPNNRHPRELYLQSNLRFTEKRTVRNDARLIGLDRHAGPTATPNYSIPLVEWINQEIENGDIIIPCCNCKKPVAVDDYVNLLPSGILFQKIDVLNNDMFEYDENLTIVIDDTDFDLRYDFTYEIFQPINTAYPAIKLNRGDGTNIENIDTPSYLKYKIINSCGEESNWATLWIYPVWFNLAELENIIL